MPSYKELFMEEYSDVYEKMGINIKHNPQVEQFKLYCGNLSRRAVREFKNGVKNEAMDKFEKALTYYEAAKEKFKRLLKEVDKRIGDEDILSWTVRLISSAQSVFSAATNALSVAKADFDMDEVTKENVKGTIQNMISACDKGIARCKQGLRESKRKEK